MKNKNILLIFTLFSLSYTNINFGSSTKSSNSFVSCLKAVFCCQCCESDCENSNNSHMRRRNTQSQNNNDIILFQAGWQHDTTNHHHCDTSHHHCDTSHHDCGGGE